MHSYRGHVYSGTAVVYSLVGHLLPIPAEGAVEGHWFTATQSLPKISIEETEALQTLHKLSENTN